jgi:hemerythrin
VDFLKLAKEISDNPHSSIVVLEVENRLSNWLVNHIKKVDKDTFTFLASKGAK